MFSTSKYCLASLVIIAPVLLLASDMTFAASHEVKLSNNKIVMRFVEVNLMPKSKRETKIFEKFPQQSSSNTTRVFKRSKIRKKLARRYGKYRHSTRVIRGKPAIVLLPPLYKRPIVQNFTVRPPAMMEHPIPVPVEPIAMPTPLPAPLISLRHSLLRKSIDGKSSAASDDTNNSAQPMSESHLMPTTLDSATSTHPSFEFNSEMEQTEPAHFQILHNEEADMRFSFINSNNSNIIHEQSQSSPVQYLLPPVLLDLQDPINSNDYEILHNTSRGAVEKTITDYAMQATFPQSAAVYQLELLKPPIYDNYYWTNSQNDTSIIVSESNPGITSSYADISDGLEKNSFIDINVSLLSSDVASMGMKVEATAKAIDMARDVMVNHAISPSSDTPKHTIGHTELPLDVAESGHFRLDKQETIYSTEGSFNRLKGKKPYKRPKDEVIPGVAGEDYPVYASPPVDAGKNPCKGGFGYIPDPSTRCQVFYVCTGAGIGEPMLCPNGTLFSRDFLVCDWWYNVQCLPS